MTAKRGALFGAIVVVIMILAPQVLSVVVYHELGRRFDIVIGGKFMPQWFQPGFTLYDAYFELDDRVRLRSGDLKVKYDPLSAVLGQGIRIWIQSDHITAELQGDWASSAGSETIEFDRFNADIRVGPEGVEEIYSIEALSPTFQFSMGLTEKNNSDTSLGDQA